MKKDIKRRNELPKRDKNPTLMKYIYCVGIIIWSSVIALIIGSFSGSTTHTAFIRSEYFKAKDPSRYFDMGLQNYPPGLLSIGLKASPAPLLAMGGGVGVYAGASPNLPSPKTPKNASAGVSGPTISVSSTRYIQPFMTTVNPSVIALSISAKKVFSNKNNVNYDSRPILTGKTFLPDISDGGSLTASATPALIDEINISPVKTSSGMGKCSEMIATLIPTGSFITAENTGIGGPEDWSFTPELTFTEEQKKLKDSVVSLDTVVLSTDLPAAPVAKDLMWIEHVVVKGEVLGAIAEKYKVPVANVLKANKLKDAAALKVGQLLLVPKDASVEAIRAVMNELAARAKKAEKAKEKAIPIKYVSYKIKPSDSIWIIAKKFGVSDKSIIACNSLKDSAKLKPGSVLRIPNQTGLPIKAEKGDTPDKLSKKYGVPLKAILSANSLTAKSQIKPGSELFMPGLTALPKIDVPSDDNDKNAKVKKEDKDAKKDIDNGDKKKDDSRKKIVTPTSKMISGAPVFRWPLGSIQISSNFGPRGRHFHPGIDLRASNGTKVFAAAPGRVVYSAWISGGYGRLVVIDHGNGWSTYYAHNSSLVVAKGAWVEAGQLIAFTGRSGRVTGPHLHFEIRKNGKVLNPRGYLP